MLSLSRRRPPTGLLPTLLSGAWVLLSPMAARATPVFEFAGAGNGLGGFNARATGASSASTYYNPALLPQAREGMDVGFLFVRDAIDVRVTPRPEGTQHDVPVGVEEYRHLGDRAIDAKPIPTQWLEQGHREPGSDQPIEARPRQQASENNQLNYYLLLGANKRLLDQYLVLGVYAALPLKEFAGTSAFYNDEREQYFSNSLSPELSADRMRAQSISFALASQLHERVALGLSVTLSLRNTADTPSYVPNAAELDRTYLDSKISVVAEFSPHLGLVVTPMDGLRLTATYHSEQKFVTDTKVRFINVFQGESQGSEVSFVANFVPRTVSLGGEADLIQTRDLGLSLVGHITWEQWSRYLDRHGERPGGHYVWSDTLNAALGVRARFGDEREPPVSSFFDVRYRPSPVPAQKGRSNYVDNHTTAFNAGVESSLSLGDLGTMRFGLNAQLHWLKPRSVRKLDTPALAQPNDCADCYEGGAVPSDRYYPQLVVDEVPDDAIHQGGGPAPGREGLQTNNPGWPGFSSKGLAFGGGAYVALDF